MFISYSNGFSQQQQQFHWNGQQNWGQGYPVQPPQQQPSMYNQAQPTQQQQQPIDIYYEDFSCPICSNLLTNAVVTSCGQSLCDFCHNAWKSYPCNTCNLLHDIAWPNTVVRNLMPKLFPDHPQPQQHEPQQVQQQQPQQEGPREVVEGDKSTPAYLNLIEGSR